MAQRCAPVTGTKRLAVPDHEGDVGPGRQAQLEDLHAVQPGVGPIRTVSTSASRAPQRRRLDVELARGHRARHPEQPRRPGQRRALHQREHDDDDEDQIEDLRGPRDAARQRDRRQHDRYGAAQAGPGQEGLLRPTAPGTRSAMTSTDSGRASSTSTSPTPIAGSTRPGSRAGSASSPSSTKSPIWAIQPIAFGEPAHRRAVRQARFPSTRPAR